MTTVKHETLDDLGIAPGLVASLVNKDDRFQTVSGTLEVLAEIKSLARLPGLSPEAGEFVEQALVQHGYQWNGEAEAEAQPEPGPEQKEQKEPKQATPHDWQEYPSSHLLGEAAPQLQKDYPDLGTLHEAVAMNQVKDEDLSIVIAQRFAKMFDQNPSWAEPSYSHPSLDDPEFEEEERAVCEACLKVHECQQALEKAKGDLKLAEEDRNVAVAKLAAAIEPEELPLFDQIEEDQAQPVQEQTIEQPSAEPAPESAAEPSQAPEVYGSWAEAPIKKPLQLTKAQLEKFEAAGVKTMQDFQDLRAGKGLESIDRVGTGMAKKLQARADEWIAQQMEIAADARPVGTARSFDTPELTPVPGHSAELPLKLDIDGNTLYAYTDGDSFWQSQNPNFGWMPAPREIIEKLEAAMGKPTLIREDEPSPRPTHIKLTVDIPGFANDSQKMYDGTTHEVKEWVNDDTVNVLTATGSQVVLRQGEWEPL